MDEERAPRYYGDYLQLDRLLDCQRPASVDVGRPAHDELLFIVVHQTYELWFKQILHELDAVLAIFDRTVADREMLAAVGHLSRVAEIGRLLVDQVDVLETMTPLDFLDFRDLLGQSSGFQSVQFRLIENRLGVAPDARPQIGGSVYTTRFTPEHRATLARSEAASTVFEVVEAWLERTPFLDRTDWDFWTEYRRQVQAVNDTERRAIETDPRLDPEARAERVAAFERSIAHFEGVFDADTYRRFDPGYRPRLSHRAFVAALLINLYRDEPRVQLPFRVLATLTDIDEVLTTWRYRHALMVRRMIGTRLGTGGTSGYDYLRQSAEASRVFNDLSTVSTFLLPRSAIPPLPPEVQRAMAFPAEASPGSGAGDDPGADGR